MATDIQLVFDTADPDAQARFWAAALGYTIQDPPQGFDTWEAFLTAQGVPEEEWNSASAITDPDGKGPRIYFQKVPEGKAAKNRARKRRSLIFFAQFFEGAGQPLVVQSSDDLSPALLRQVVHHAGQVGWTQLIERGETERVIGALATDYEGVPT